MRRAEVFPACLLFLPVFLFGCFQADHVPEFSMAETRPGGETTVSNRPFSSFIKPAANLAEALRPDFYAGKALAHQPWVKAPTATTARDGLGPVYNARTCLACHANGGRGIMPANSETPLVSAFVRISLPGQDQKQGVVPEPVYGDQLQTQSVSLSHQLRAQHSQNPTNSPSKHAKHEVQPEAYVHVEWRKKSFTYEDGVAVELRFPEIKITHLGYGALHPGTLKSLRNAPPIHGVGLIEGIHQKAIDAYADPDDKDGNGISGRVNQVWDPASGQTAAGRFGLKANRPANLRVVTAAAFAGDIGISNPMFSDQPCTALQMVCQNAQHGNDEAGFELSADLLDLVTDFTRSIGVPAARHSASDSMQQGRALFYETGCHQCHVPSYTTQPSEQWPHLSQQTIWPYSDFLLHDMGAELADSRSDFEATGSEWRTPPLWGVGLSKKVNGSDHLLHDGRAWGVEEAILWHGGEAEGVKSRFTRLSKPKRNLLIKFVESL